MNKKDLSERDICTKFITPAVKDAGWDVLSQIREQVYFTKGRIIVRGKLVTRGKAKFADHNCSRIPRWSPTPVSTTRRPPFIMIYLDHNATTPVLPEVLAALMPYLTTEWGNPSSAYKFGSKVKSVIETARAQVAELIRAQPREVIFTSCVTESNNAAIHAALKANPNKRHIITSAVEHSSVLNYCIALRG